MVTRRTFVLQVATLAAPLVVVGRTPAQAAKPLALPANPSAEFLATIDANYRELVRGVMRSPTVTARHAEESFFAQPALYDWFLEHPDRASLAWRRLNVPCAEVVSEGRGAFAYKDEAGSHVSWRPVAKFTDGVVWYATGQVKFAPLLPVVAVKGVAILKCPRKSVGKTGEAAIFEPSTTIYAQTDSRAASAVLRLVGPAAPRLAEQGAEQLLLFFSGPSRYVFDHPEDGAKLLAPPDLASPRRRGRDPRGGSR